MVDFGIRLKKLRTSRHLTQQNLAQRLGLTKSVISAYETDTRSPSYETLVRIAAMFNVSSDYLLGIEKTQVSDVSGLSDHQINLVKALTEELRKKSE